MSIAESGMIMITDQFTSKEQDPSITQHGEKYRATLYLKHIWKEIPGPLFTYL